MRKLIVVLILFVGYNVSNGQTIIDSISLKIIAVTKTLEDLDYQIPESLLVKHFLIVCKYPRIDPVVSYNSGLTLSDNSLLILSKLQTGDILELKEVYGMKHGSMDKREVLLPNRKFIVK